MVQEKEINRRQFLKAMGAFAALPLLSCSSPKTMLEWDGVALGADSNIKIFHPSKEKAKQILSAALQEVQRLEKMFSLYRDDSLIVQLNKNGFLDNPPKEFVQLIEKAIYFGDVTNGQFDITVQPLWNKSGGAELVDYKKIQLEKNKIHFSQANMQITLNGIAQGFITDKISNLLRNAGVKNALISLGEKYALGTHPSGRKWQVGIAGSSKVIELENQGIATSNNEGKHIFNPRTGALAKARTVTVLADSATKADALATALCLGDIDGIEDREKIQII